MNTTKVEVETQTSGAGSPPKPPVRTAWPGDASEPEKPKRRAKEPEGLIMPTPRPPSDSEFLACLDKGMREATERSVAKA